nr:glycosyltransferase 87 family protein [Corynebacterium mendelii]
MWLTAAITRAIYPLIHATGFIPLAPAAVFFIVNAVLLSGLWLGTIVLLRRLAGPRPWDVLLAAACPIVIMHAFTNWDMLPIFFAVLAVAAAARGSSTAAGVAIGVGTAFKLWPLFLLGAYLTLAVRHKTFRPFSLMLAGASASWVAINLPVYLAWPDGWMEFWRMNSTRGAEWSTVYALINRLTGYDTFHTADSGPGLLNSISMVAFILCCAAILALGTGARYRPRVAQLIFLILVAFVLTNKVYSPQYSMWLVPFAVLAVGNRPKLVVSWMLADMMLWPILCWTMLGADNKALPDPFLNTIVTLRGVLLVALAVVVVRTIMGKHDDPLAGADGTTDPLAGDFAPPSPRVAGHPAGDQPASGNNCEGAAAPGKDTCA